jgi:hypothetical protein
MTNKVFCTMQDAHDFCREFYNGTNVGEVVFDSNTIILFNTLAHTF